MKTWLMLSLFCIGLFSLNCVQSTSFSITRTTAGVDQELQAAVDPTVGLIIDQKSSSMKLSEFILELTETYLISTDFRVQVDYDKIKVILEEEELSYTDLFNPDTRTELGKKLGVTYLVLINNLVETSGNDVQIFISLKIINIETGKIAGILNLQQSPVIWTVDSNGKISYAMARKAVNQEILESSVKEFLTNLRGGL